MLSNEILKSLEYFTNCRIFISAPSKNNDLKESTISSLNMLVTKENGFSYHENYEMSITNLDMKSGEPVFKFSKQKTQE